MTTEELLSKFRAEVERIKKSYDVYLARVTKEDFLNDLDNILSFLDTLEKEDKYRLDMTLKTEHYRITIDVTTEFDGGNRCGDIEHNLYMIEKELLPYTVKTKKVEYKVEKLALTDLDMDKYNDAMALAEKFEEGYKAGVYDTKNKILRWAMEHAKK